MLRPAHFPRSYPGRGCHGAENPPTRSRGGLTFMSDVAGERGAVGPIRSGPGRRMVDPPAIGPRSPLGRPGRVAPERTVMTIGMVAPPHENGPGRGYARRSAARGAEAGLCLVHPARERTWPDPDSTHVGPHPVAPGPPGSTQSKLLHALGVAPPARVTTGRPAMDVPARPLRRPGRPQEDRRRLRPPRRARRRGRPRRSAPSAP